MRKNAAIHFLPGMLWLNDKHKHFIACYMMQIENREYL